jgi:nicotinamide riboside kinase
VNVPFKSDGIRQEVEDERDRFHETFLALFAEKGIPFELISGTFEQRTARIETIIKS